LPIVEQALALKIKVGRPYVVWMQLSVVNEQPVLVAQKAVSVVIMDKCLMIEYHHLP
jgi:predicted CoA-binding protein